VHGGDDRTGPFGLDYLTPVLSDPEAGAQQRLGGSGSQRDHYLGLHQPQLLLKPRLAGAHLGGVWLLVQSPLDQLLAHELEVLDGIGDVHHTAIEPRGFQRLVEEPAGGPDERPADAILLIPRLLANEECRGARRTFAEYRLGRVHPQIAAAAAGGRLSELRQSRTRGDEICRGAGRYCSSHTAICGLCAAGRSDRCHPAGASPY
jgi:hypothetical protein